MITVKDLHEMAQEYLDNGEFDVSGYARIQEAGVKHLLETEPDQDDINYWVKARDDYDGLGTWAYEIAAGTPLLSNSELFVLKTLDLSENEQRARFVNEMDDADRALFVRLWRELTASEFDYTDLVEWLPEAAPYIPQDDASDAEPPRYNLSGSQADRIDFDQMVQRYADTCLDSLTAEEVLEQTPEYAIDHWQNLQARLTEQNDIDDTEAEQSEARTRFFATFLPALRDRQKQIRQDQLDDANDTPDDRTAATETPIYPNFYITSDDGTIPVHFPDFSGETDGYDAKLKLVEDLCDIHRARADGHLVTRTIYVEVAHPLEYPYAKWDCEYTGESFKERLTGEPQPAVRYCEAALVATPKLALI